MSKTLNYWLNHLVAFTLVVIVSWGLFASPAPALLRQHHETLNVLRYHAQDSLKDRDGNTWQVVLFPDKTQGEKTTYYLRLVGFPGVNSFNHPQSLEVLTSQGKVLTAPDAYAQSAPAPNVGQYDFTSIVSQLSRGCPPNSFGRSRFGKEYSCPKADRGLYAPSGEQSFKLSVPLQAHQELALKIPPAVLEEWQLLTQEIE